MTAPQQEETETALCLDSPVITTDRLILRPPHEEDAEELALLANNENIARMLAALPHPYTEDDAREFIARTSASSRRACVYAITEAESGRLVGIGGLHEDKSRHDEPYMGYWLGEPYWGKGYATESARALVDLYFKVTNRPVLMATLRRDNDASRAVIEKCGGRLHSTTEATHPLFGGKTVLEHYRITRESWMGQIAA